MPCRRPLASFVPTSRGAVRAKRFRSVARRVPERPRGSPWGFGPCSVTRQVTGWCSAARASLGLSRFYTSPICPRPRPADRRSAASASASGFFRIRKNGRGRGRGRGKEINHQSSSVDPPMALPNRRPRS